MNFQFTRAFTSLAFLFTACFFSCDAQAQTVLFDIDNNTTVSGGTVTQTVTQGGSTFVLTATHSSGLDAVIGSPVATSDQSFFSTDQTDMTPTWTLSLSQDGAAVNFNLDQVGYLSVNNLIPTSFDLINDSGGLITNNFVIDDSTTDTTGLLFDIDNPTNTNNIGSFDIIGSFDSVFGTGSSTDLTSFDNIQLTVVPTGVPEPGSLSFLGLSSLVLLSRRRKR